MRKTSAKPKVFLAAMIVLTAVTWAVGLLDIQYTTESTIGFAEGFPGDTSEWDPAGDPANIVISEQGIRIERNTAERSYALRSFALPDPAQLQGRNLRVRGLLTTLSRAAPIERERVAAFMIWFQDEEREPIQYITVQALTGDFPTYRAERIVSVPVDARYFVTALINRDSSGSFELTYADVQVVSTSAAYRIIGPILIALWILLLGLATLWVTRRGSLKTGAAIGILLVLTLIGILLPESVTYNYVLPIYQKLASLLSLEHAEPLGIVYKFGHFVFFFLVALCLLLNKRSLRLSVLMILAFMAVFAVATEGLQLHLFSRSTRLLDLGVDLSGVVLAWIVATVIGSFLRKKRRRRRH